MHLENNSCGNSLHPLLLNEEFGSMSKTMQNMESTCFYLSARELSLY